MKKVILSLAVIAFSSVILSGCNTVEGLGKDVETAGTKIKNSVK